MNLKAILIEDESNSREILRNYLKKYCPKVDLVGEAASIKEGLMLINNNDLDLIFLDVEMPFGNAESVLNSKSKGVSGKLTLPQQDGFQILNVEEILYCKADDNYTEIFLENKKILVSKTLKYFEEALSVFPFARVHKSYLVNVNEVVKYKKGKGGSVVMSNGKELLVSASKKKQFLFYKNGK